MLARGSPRMTKTCLLMLLGFMLRFEMCRKAPVSAAYRNLARGGKLSFQNVGGAKVYTM